MTSELYEKGLETRRSVLGDDYVNQAISTADVFTKPFQEFITKYAWGEIWNRPNLSRRNRSMINLAMLTALNRPHELKLHLRGAITNGVTKEEIAEILMQSAIYCGVPAALDSFRIAQQILSEDERQEPK